MISSNTNVGSEPSLKGLRTDELRSSAQCSADRVQLSISSDLTMRLWSIARERDLSFPVMLLCGWTILLGRWSGQDEVVMRTQVVRSRTSQLNPKSGGSESAMTMRLVLHNDARIAMLCRHAVSSAHTSTIQQISREGTDETLKYLCGFGADLGRMGVVDTPEQISASAELRLSGARHNGSSSQDANLRVDLLVSFHERSLAGELDYHGDLIDREAARRMLACWSTLLEGIAIDPEKPIMKMPIVAEIERKKVIHAFNDTAASFPRDVLIPELFEEQVRRTPHVVALVCGQQTLTYAELNGRANKLARHLIDAGVGPDQLVGICIDRSVEMVVGLLGILKAGGAYVPLDPSHPSDRLQYMLNDAGPRVLLTNERLKKTLPPSVAHVTAIDERWEEISRWGDGNLGRRSCELSSRNLAYVIYTSGSTGNPKGVMVEHAAVVNFLLSMQESPGMKSTDCLLAVTTVSFDIAGLEIYLPLVTGAQLVLSSREAASDARVLTEMLEEFDVTVLQATPATWQLLLSGGWSGKSDLKALCGGEALTTNLSGKLISRVGALWNLYGPTETAIWSCGQQVAVCEQTAAEAIGRPIANTQIYILDTCGQVVPIGFVGEIYIGGAGVARGYLNRPKLTAAHFISDPFGADPHARLYKTGDLGRWRPDGTIEYVGRNDHQVKIRGYRIELGEIEAQLERHAQVSEAVVIAREDVPGEKRLIAYVILRAGKDMRVSLNAEALRAHLRSALPEFMVPSAFVVLDRFPLTPNRKLDRHALPAPDLAAYATRQYEAPQGEVETILANIWQELLSVERVGRQDNFFELGGHSLIIGQMIERLRRAGLTTEVHRVFESSKLVDLANALTTEGAGGLYVPPSLIPTECEAITPQMLPLVELEPSQIERIVQLVRGGAANIQDIYPLTPLQEGMLFHHLLDEQGGDTYVSLTVLSVSSRQRLDELVTALQRVIDRHDALRTAVLWEQLPRPVQVVCRRAALPVEEISMPWDRDPAELVNEWIEPKRHRMDLQHAPLMRLQVAADPHHKQLYALLQVHHMIDDDISLRILISEVVAHLEGRAQDLPPSVPYREHVAQAVVHARVHEAEDFFREKLRDIDEPTAPFDVFNVRGDGTRIDEASQALEPTLARRVRAQARHLSVSAAALFHAAWALVVANTSGRNDVVFGSVLSGRSRGSVGAKQTVGIFINTLPLRLRLQDVTARHLVEQAQRALGELLHHEQASLAMAQRCSGISGAAPLFSCVLNYRHQVLDHVAEWGSASGIRVLTVQSRTNYPITLSVDDLGDGFAFTAQTDRNIDPHRIVACLHKAMQSLVEALEHAPMTGSLTLSIVPDSERHKVIHLFNQTHKFYPREKLVHELFEEQVERTPEAIAVLYEGESLSYAELNGRANQLANFLREQGMQVGDYIPILMPRGLQMMIAQLAVLKSGGVYVPIDSELPVERLAFIIRDCGARQVIAPHVRYAGLEVGSIQWIDSAAQSGSMGNSLESSSRPRMDATPPAYVMYTSGSTGVPKGVVVPHHAVVRLVINNGYAQIESTDRIAHYSNTAFDASTLEIWGALLNGASLALIPQSIVLEPMLFARALSEQRVTVLWMSVGLFSQYIDALADVFARLRYLFVGGDVVEPWMIRRVMRRSPPRHLLNAYGPTECTTFSTTYPIDTVDDDTRSIPIGHPISNAQVYILGKHLQPVPIGVTGEIYIGGAGVALGYLNRPELTAERFIGDPFSRDSGTRLYKSGDLGRWRVDGNIEFLGRNDQQVKLRGFRIELGEIEARLVRHEHVQEAVVVVREDVPGEKRLVAYITPRDQLGPSAETLHAHLKPVLPAYMVPSAFVILQKLPLTPSGKLNRRELPAPELKAYARQQYEAPQGEIEEAVAEIWQGLLNIDRVGRHDDFFELGGHSLLATRVITHIDHVLDIDIPLRALFEKPTIEGLAHWIVQEIAAEVSMEAP